MNRDTSARFPQTRWTLIRQARQLTVDQRREVLETLVQIYWRPLYAYFRAKGQSVSDAEDAVQTFLIRFADEPDALLSVSPDEGRFRNWLMACAKNHMLDRERQKRAKKRSPEKPVISLDALKHKDGKQFEPAAGESPESAYIDAWRRELLDRALSEVAALCADSGREVDYEIFRSYYMEEDPKRTWQQLADEHQLPSWKHAARRADLSKFRSAKQSAAKFGAMPITMARSTLNYARSSDREE